MAQLIVMLELDSYGLFYQCPHDAKQVPGQPHTAAAWLLTHAQALCPVGRLILPMPQLHTNSRHKTSREFMLWYLGPDPEHFVTVAHAAGYPLARRLGQGSYRSRVCSEKRQAEPEESP